jgi:hypothetical protein
MTQAPFNSQLKKFIERLGQYGLEGNIKLEQSGFTPEQIEKCFCSETGEIFPEEIRKIYKIIYDSRNIVPKPKPEKPPTVKNRKTKKRKYSERLDFSSGKLRIMYYCYFCKWDMEKETDLCQCGVW